jgi:preprotein translocase subunit SecE
MASKVAMANPEDKPNKRQEPSALSEFGGNAMSTWTNFTRFLSDVRAEMRKVVVPSQKEVKVTTSVVIIAVFIFGLFFFVVDYVFNIGVHELLVKLGGLQ